MLPNNEPRDPWFEGMDWKGAAIMALSLTVSLLLIKQARLRERVRPAGAVLFVKGCPPILTKTEVFFVPESTGNLAPPYCVQQFKVRTDAN